LGARTKAGKLEKRSDSLEKDLSVWDEGVYWRYKLAKGAKK